MELVWIEDLKAERDLRKLGISFSVQSVSFSAIDLIESIDNLARLIEPLRRELIDEYKMAMLDGDAFPMVVVRKVKSVYILLGGNQRCTAIKELITEGMISATVEIPLYLIAVETEPMFIAAAVRSLNVGHGGRATFDERIAHAVWMVKHEGMAIKDVAGLFKVGANTIQTRLRAEDTRSELQRSGVEASQLTQHTLDKLSQLRHDNKTFRQLGALVTQHTVTGDRLDQVVAEVRKKKSDSDRMMAVKEFEKELAASSATSSVRKNGARTPLRPRRDRLFSELRRLSNWLENGSGGEAFRSLRQLQVTNKEDEKIVSDLWSRLKGRMHLILGAK